MFLIIQCLPVIWSGTAQQTDKSCESSVQTDLMPLCIILYIYSFADEPKTEVGLKYGAVNSYHVKAILNKKRAKMYTVSQYSHWFYWCVEFKPLIHTVSFHFFLLAPGWILFRNNLSRVTHSLHSKFVLQLLCEVKGQKAQANKLFPESYFAQSFWAMNLHQLPFLRKISRQSICFL